MGPDILSLGNPKDAHKPILRAFYANSSPLNLAESLTRTSWKTGEHLRRIRDLTHVLNPLDQRV
jgi:hypothetical protein